MTSERISTVEQVARPAARDGPAWLSRLVLTIGLLALLIPKAVFHPYPVGPLSDDGSLYYQIARHVAEGDGLQTSVSLYSWGFRILPHVTHVYPLWPLVLGYAGRVIGLDRATTLLPPIFYFTALGLLYWLTLTVLRSVGAPALVRWRGMAVVDAGHLVVAIFGLNPIFFRYSSLPFTEPLAFTLAFAALLAACYAVRGSRLSLALLAGIHAGTAFLARSQMLGLMLALPLATVLLGRKGFRLSALLMIGSALAVAPWLLFLRHGFEALPLRALLDTGALRETPELVALNWIVQPPTRWAYLLDRLQGFLTAFDRSRSVSYVGSFGDVAYLALLGLAYSTVRSAAYLVGTRRGAARAAPSLPDREAAFPILALTLTGLLLLLPIHEMHMNRWGGWNFGVRHGLPLILLIVSAAAMLLRARWWWRGPAILALLLGVYQSAVKTRHEIWNRDRYTAPSLAQMDLASWIERQSHPPLIATVRANPLGAITRGRYHEVQCGDSRQQMLVYIDHLRVEYVLTSESAERCAFFTAIPDRLRLSEVFGSGSERLRLWSTLP
jgi:hypothetical protein